ncbi:MAG: arylsulfatase [Planctomycetota bacterium]
MNRRDFLRGASLSTASFLLGCGFSEAIKRKVSSRPNVILIMTDDQGYGDLSCLGNPILKTPNMDQLHSESVRLTNFHVDPSCSPTRSALMTGCYSHRVKVWHTILGRNFLLKGQPTMADVFRSNGYRTGHFGKWHLGGNYPYRPMDRGFEEWVGHGDGGTGTATDYWNNDRVNDMVIRNGSTEPSEGYSPDVFFDETMKFIRTHKDKDAPFFVYLATYVPHGPHSLPEKKWVDAYRDKVELKTAYFYAAISRVDHNLGRLRKFLAREGLADNTILVFLTDNGTSSGGKIFNAGMRGYKGSQYDGGHRVPCFIHWPDGGIEGGKDVDRLTAHIDLLPTLEKLCRLDNSKPLNYDGKSLVPLLEDPSAAWTDRTLVVESQRIAHPQKWRKCSVMTDRWRLIDGKELYNMSVDPGQEKDIARAHPGIVDQLRAEYERYWSDVTKGDAGYYSRSILGSLYQPEVTLCAEDWMPFKSGEDSPWSQAHILQASARFGFWPVEIAVDGIYRVELRRWPREAETPIRGIPPEKEPSEIDAYLNDRPINRTLYYGSAPKAVPAAHVCLKIGDITRESDIARDDAAKVFTLDLKSGSAQVEAWLLDETGKKLCGVYFVYIRRIK